MEQAPKMAININGLQPQEVERSKEITEVNKCCSFPFHKKYEWLFQMVIYSFFLLAGLTVGNLLGRVYFDNGGHSKWLATLVQVVGYPILFPFQWFSTEQVSINTTESTNSKIRSPFVLPSIYIVFGIWVAQNCMLYTIGLQYLPITTYTLICASQLGFNALFSFFLNKQKFTPYIVNSVFLLTLSSILLIFQNEPGESTKSSRTKYIIGFLCTLGASAGYALLLSVTQVTFKRIIKKETIRAILDMTIYENLVATFVILIGLFASGEFMKLNEEMNEYKLGKVSYVMNLIWTAISWQVFSVGCIGLIFKISSLFSNVISILGLPLAPVLAVVFLNDKLTGLKVVSMVLAMWGFVSYAYQQYIEDDSKEKERRNGAEVSELAVIERG